jgi:serine protease
MKGADFVMTTTDNQPTTAKSNAPDSRVHTVLDAEAQGRKQGHGDIGLVPVAVLAAAPPWRSPAAGRGVRRPVIALPDSGVEQHPWLDGTPDDQVVCHAGDSRWQPPKHLNTSEPRHYRGHATFVAGVIRQTAPDCRMLSARIMGDDGVVEGADSLSVLTYLADRAESKEPERFVDIICLAYGFQLEAEPSPDDISHIGNLREQLTRLAQAHVLVVASAGNYGNGRKTYPAALAVEPALTSNMVSVGATNPNGHYAYYSNWGRWVTHQAIGSGVISTMPKFNGPRSPDGLEPEDKLLYPDPRGVTVDPDDFTDRFARWSGTSFSAATVAGLLGQALAGDPAPPGPERTARALAAIGSYKHRPQESPA